MNLERLAEKVAEHVFGWTFLSREDQHRSTWRNPDRGGSYMGIGVHSWEEREGDGYANASTCYFTDELIDRLRERGYIIDLEIDKSLVTARLKHGDKMLSEYLGVGRHKDIGPALSLAILEALGVTFE